MFSTAVSHHRKKSSHLHSPTLDKAVVASCRGLPKPRQRELTLRLDGLVDLSHSLRSAATEAYHVVDPMDMSQRCRAMLQVVCLIYSHTHVESWPGGHFESRDPASCTNAPSELPPVKHWATTHHDGGQGEPGAACQRSSLPVLAGSPFALSMTGFLSHWLSTQCHANLALFERSQY